MEHDPTFNPQIALQRLQDLVEQVRYHTSRIQVLVQEVEDIAVEVGVALDEQEERLNQGGTS